MTPRLLVLACIVWAPVAQARSAEMQFDERVRPLPHAYMGPFVRRADGAIVGIDGDTVTISRDGGQTWNSHPLFDAEQAEALSVRPERALFQTRGGTLLLAFMNERERKWTWSNEQRDAPGARLPTYVIRSTDGGQTWDDLHKLHDEWTGAVRDIIQTRDGRLVLATMKLLHDPGRHAVITYSSEDDGKSWRPSNLIDLGGSGHHGGISEPTLVELNDGRVWMLIRTNWGRFWSAYSSDGGRSWRTIQPSEIPSSSAPAILTRLASGRLVIVWNRPYPEDQDSFPLTGGDGLWSEVPVSNHRGELSIAFSDADGESWTTPVVIARQPGKWLSYPYVFEPSPGTLWITTMQGAVRIELREEDFVGG